MKMFIAQNARNVIADDNDSPTMLASPPRCAKPGANVTMNVFSASPPTKALMPNHPHATSARSTAGMFAPLVPKLARANTGNEMP